MRVFAGFCGNFYVTKIKQYIILQNNGKHL
jgi:hypothetical protein